MKFLKSIKETYTEMPALFWQRCGIGFIHAASWISGGGGAVGSLSQQHEFIYILSGITASIFFGFGGFFIYIAKCRREDDS